MIGYKLFSRAKEMWEKKEWRPLLLSVRPTMRCDARCLMCGNWKQPDTMIDFSVLPAAVGDAAAETGVIIRTGYFSDIQGLKVKVEEDLGQR